VTALCRFTAHGDFRTHPDYPSIASARPATSPRELLCVFFGFGTDDCHSDEAESSASGTPEEGSVHLVGGIAGADECIGPSARKERGPQDDKGVFRALARQAIPPSTTRRVRL
jgi:hypothetical protein